MSFTRTHRAALAGLLAAFSVRAGAAVSDDGLWHTLSERPRAAANAQPWVQPVKFQGCSLDVTSMSAVLASAPREGTMLVSASPLRVALPMPDGTFEHFTLVESPIMEPELAAKYPQIRTYLGQGVEDRAAVARIDLTPAGFHGQILSPSGAVYVDPYWKNDTSTYASYYEHDDRATEDWRCLTDDATTSKVVADASHGIHADATTQTLRTYRLACAADGEYTTYQGGTVAAGMAAIVTAMNRVDGVYESEFAIRMVLVANDDLLVFTNSNSDGYTNNDGGTMLGQNQTIVDSIIGSANYDIGHVFSTGGGGIAYLGCVCQSNDKAGGVTGTSAPTGDAFTIDYVAHEMGHQFGANHSFNGEGDSCGGGNRNGPTAYEPGSGSTIMCYAGICGNLDDLQQHSDPYFHSISYDEIVRYTTTGAGNGCAAQSATGNHAPTVVAGPSYTIPANTPFTLTAASAGDPDGDALTYCWEERDLGPSQDAIGGGNSGDNGRSPLFRSFNPVASPSRTFPQLAALQRNTTFIGERLPTTSRTMSFRVTVRDNKAGGGAQGYDSTTVTSSTTAGPFQVTIPAGTTWAGGTTQTVTWSVANTTASPINAASVNILFSADNGVTFPYVLASAAPNNGSAVVTVPNVATLKGRVKVQAVGNIFFGFSVAIPVSAIWYVNTPASGGSDAHGGLSATDAFATIAHAISIAATGDVINISAGTFASPKTLDRTFSFTGAGPNATLIDGGGTDRVLTVVQGHNETFSNLGFVNGSTSDSGAGIMNGGGNTLTLTNCAIRNNAVTFGGAHAGAIYNDDAGTVVLNNCAIENNTAAGDAGGIFNVPSGTVTATGCTFAGNTAFSDAVATNSGTMALTNCTISSNTAQNDTGALFNGGTLTLQSCTISANSAASSPGGITSTGTLTVQNTIIAANASDDGYAVDGNGALTSLGYNLIGTADGFTVSAASGDLLGSDTTPLNPRLQPLADNGGPTRTQALAANSPAVNAASPAVFPATDQRGITRPQGARADIGAYELVAPAPFTASDVANALRIAAGITAASPSDITRLNVEQSGPGVDLRDAVRIARKAAGLDP